jgi:uncharacterized protein YrzB (UPF0473 family)
LSQEQEYEVVTLYNDDGLAVDFEVIMTFEVEENDYAALLPLDEDDPEVLLFKMITDDEETTFTPIEDEDEFDIVAESYYDFMK